MSLELVTRSIHILDMWVVPLVLRFIREHLSVHWWIITWWWREYISPKQCHLFNTGGGGWGATIRYNFNPHIFFLNLLILVGKLTFLFLFFVSGTAELDLSRLIVTANHQDKQKILVIEFFFENSLHYQFEVRLLLFTVRTGVWTFRSCLIWSSISHNTVLYLIR